MIKTKPKPKKCKGTHKHTYGIGCNTEQEKRILGLGISCGCYSQFLRETPQGKERVRNHTLKATKPRRELEQAEQERKQTTTLSNLIQSVVNVCHKYIRKRDEGKPCIACGANWNEHFQAGHFYKAELYSNVRFDEYNIAGSCRVCNLHKDGNFQGYREGFIKRYSVEQLEELENKVNQYKHQSFKWDREELKKLRNYYKNK